MTDTRDVSATEVLQELANFIDGTAAASVRVRDRQLQIDLSWTTVELKPATVETYCGRSTTTCGITIRTWSRSKGAHDNDQNG